MARFDLHRRCDGGAWLLNIQHPSLGHLPTRLVVPVLPARDAPPPLGELTPQIELEGEPHIVFPPYMAAVETRQLGHGRPVPAAELPRIQRALEIMQHGF
jgi:toxin CcdB